MPEDMRMLVGQRIRELRRGAHLSQEELARHSNTSTKHIGEVERGNENVSLDYICRIASALKVEPFELLAGPNEKRAPSTKARSVTKLLERLDAETLSMVVDLVGVIVAHRDAGAANKRGR